MLQQAEPLSGAIPEIPPGSFPTAYSITVKPGIPKTGPRIIPACPLMRIKGDQEKSAIFAGLYHLK